MISHCRSRLPPPSTPNLTPPTTKTLRPPTSTVTNVNNDSVHSTEQGRRWNNTEHVFFEQISQQTLFGHFTRTQTLSPKDFGHKGLQNTCRITAIVVGDYQLQRGTRNTHQIFLQSHSQLVKCGKTKRMQISL